MLSRVFLLFVVFLQFLIFPKALADNCKQVDLNSNSKSPFNKIPIYDQDGVGLCYAYSMTQMIDYYRLSHGESGLTNPVYAGWATYYKNVNYFKANSLQSGGNGDEVVDALKKVGVCSDNEVKKLFSHLTQRNDMTEAQSLHFLETMYKQYNGIFASNNWETAFKEIRSQTAITCRHAMSLKQRLEKSGLFALAPTAVLDHLFQGCKLNPIDIPDVERFDYGSDDQMENVITNNFKKNLPVQVSICSSIFANPQVRDRRGIGGILRRGSNGNIKSTCGIHAVLLTAEANINGQCNYLIRNSWGASWYPDGATSCACILDNGNYKQTCKKGEGVEYVGCWFKKTDLLPNLGSVTAFK